MRHPIRRQNPALQRGKPGRKPAGTPVVRRELPKKIETDESLTADESANLVQMLEDLKYEQAGNTGMSYPDQLIADAIALAAGVPSSY